MPRTVRSLPKATREAFHGFERPAETVKTSEINSVALLGVREAKTVDILIVDPQPVSRAGIAAVFQGVPLTRVPREAETVTVAFSALALALPDLLIMEINLNGPSGLDVIRQLIAFYPDLKILVFPPARRSGTPNASSAPAHGATS